MPFVAILLLAALLTVPRELKEAAATDGASGWQVFWHVTLLWIRPVLFVVVVLRFMDAFRKFEAIQQLTNGGPGLASTPINLHIYNTGLFYHRVGYAAAWGTVMVGMILLSLLLVYLAREAPGMTPSPAHDVHRRGPPCSSRGSSWSRSPTCGSCSPRSSGRSTPPRSRRVIFSPITMSNWEKLFSGPFPGSLVSSVDHHRRRRSWPRWDSACRRATPSRADASAAGASSAAGCCSAG